MSVPPEEPNAELPFTLDLRRPEPIEYRPPAQAEQPAPVGRVTAGVLD